MQVDRLADMRCLGACDTRARAGGAALWGHRLAARAASAGRLLAPQQRGALGGSVGSRAGCMPGRARGGAQRLATAEVQAAGKHPPRCLQVLAGAGRAVLLSLWPFARSGREAPAHPSASILHACLRRRRHDGDSAYIGPQHGLYACSVCPPLIEGACLAPKARGRALRAMCSSNERAARTPPESCACRAPNAISPCGRSPHLCPVTARTQKFLHPTASPAATAVRWGLSGSGASSGSAKRR